MIPESLESLAAAGAGALVQAAGSDAWTRVSGQVARWMGRGDPQAERFELERLRAGASRILTAEGDERVMIRQEAVWQERMLRVAEALGDADRHRATDELQALVEAWGMSPAGTTTVTSRDTNTAAGDGSVSVQNVQGGVHIGFPTVPDPSQG
ncbi:hypothetical protein ACIO93_12775 [Streptomyces sp. NPDC087903]|uniref:hypothetical protein n=1 Tax=Streptomyces sp. NPDC087903 TaxID=3365819 RepID=UPI0037F8FBD9